MSMSETDFHEAADQWLDRLFELLESEDDEARLDIDYDEGIMTITIDNDSQLLLSKHTPSRQIWLSSPVSGGLHFSAVDSGLDWALPDGRRLSIVIAEELHHFTGEDFTPNAV